ncbi:hypothetical protein [Herbiconiux ginsengi]|uniref:Uncharacterized protein n=1 Tax=Herbiconiux ginsengi TaxID=381665 RepID=A0A1H3SW60_9MICO|nr:hypothetical protein [Herbiconiux ginsengi]SDZ42174.1 hypothetical protein SAMN05216554_3762 [Herbiconiux ginsengi]
MEWSDGSAGILDPVPLVDERGCTVRVTITPAADGPAGRPRIALSHGEDASGWWIGVDEQGRAVVGLGTVAGPVSLAAGAPLAPGEAAAIAALLPGAPGERLEIRVRAAGWIEEAAASVVVGARMLPPRGRFRRGARSERGGELILPFHGTVSGLMVTPGKHP